MKYENSATNKIKQKTLK